MQIALCSFIKERKGKRNEIIKREETVKADIVIWIMATGNVL